MLKNYLKVALKVLARRKFFTFISLFGISLTLVVLLVATSMLDHVFAPQAPEVFGDRTLGVYLMGMQGERGAMTGFAGYQFLDRFVRPMTQLPFVEAVTCFSLPATGISYPGGKKIESMVKRTDGEFWQVLRFHFLEGGPYTAEDDRNARFVAVINESTRAKFFHGQPAVGKTVEVDGQRFRVVGVVSDVPILRIAPFADIWMPLGTSKSDLYKRELVGNFMGLIVARSRADFPQIKSEVKMRLKQAESLLPNPKMFKELTGGADTPFEAVARFILSSRLEDSQPGRLLIILIGLAVIFMLLPTVNLVNINLSRILDRSSEIGVRKAFGASSWTLVGQFLVENVVLTLVGGAIGLALAAIALHAINASGVIPYARLSLNLRVFGYGLAIALFFGLFSGVYPAWRMSKLHPVMALRGRSV
ncbi:MAG TPA: ABC transporter permease [Thermoanaerobaculia bacterium]|jgi:putative ABC transport system permease protein|nr:ABC transporter permease [Thermoanaerobaculia bacterium]